MSLFPTIMVGLVWYYQQIGLHRDPEIPYRTEEIPPIPSTITITTRPRKRGGRSRPGGDDSNHPYYDTEEELRHMLGVLRAIEPIGPEEWQRVVERHGEAFPKRDGDDVDSIRRKFSAWHSNPIPTEDPTCPWYVKEARAIKQLIDQKAAKLGVVVVFDGVVDEDGKEILEDDIDDGESVTSSPPRTADSIRRTFYEWYRSPIPTEDPTCPWYVKEARAIKKLIDQKAAELGVVVDEDGKVILDNDIDDGEFVTSTAPRAPPPAPPTEQQQQQQPLDGVPQPGKPSRPTREESDLPPPLPAAAAAAAAVAPAAVPAPSLPTLPTNPSPTKEESDIASTSSSMQTCCSSSSSSGASSLARKRARIMDLMRQNLDMQRKALEQAREDAKEAAKEAAAERKQFLEELRASIEPLSNSIQKNKKKRKRREPVDSNSSSNSSNVNDNDNDNETKKRKRRQLVESRSNSDSDRESSTK